MEDVHIPVTFTFKDLVSHKNNPQDMHFVKALHLLLKPGDCVHIPAFWWYQIQTSTPLKPKKDGEEEDKKKFME